MDCARDEFLPCSTLTTNQHGSPRVFQTADHAQYLSDIGRFADDSVEFLICLDTFPKDPILLHQLNFFFHPAKQHPEFLDSEWLLDVVIRAQFHGFDGRFDGPVPRHDDYFSTPAVAT